MKQSALALVIALLASAAPQAASAEEGRFYFNVCVGGSAPSLAALSDELALQGGEKPSTGYSLAVSLGRSFRENKWAAEAHFSVSFYPPFDYANEYDDFEGKLSHYSFGAVARRRFLEESWLVPSVGAGIGYGITNLIQGGGKLQAFEALVVGRLEARMTPNVSFSLEGVYHAGLREDSFEDAFLGDIETGLIKKSDGTVLKDAFDSIDVRIGITFWLKQKELRDR